MAEARSSNLRQCRFESDRGHHLPQASRWPPAPRGANAPLRRLGTNPHQGVIDAHHAGRPVAAHLLLGRPGLPHGPADEHRGRCRHAQPRDVPAGARPGAVAGRLRRAVGAPGRLPLRREPQPAADAHPAPGDPQARAGQRAGALPGQPGRARHRRGRARRAVRRGQLGLAGARRLGPGLGGLARRPGDHPVHLLPAGGRDQPRPAVGGDHLRHGADHHGAPGRAPFQGHRVRARSQLRRGLRPAGVRDVPLLPRRRRRGGQPGAPRAVRRRGAADGRRRAAGARAHLRTEELARVQRAGRPRRRLHLGPRRRVRPDAPAGRRGRQALDRPPRGAGPPARRRGRARAGHAPGRRGGTRRHSAAGLRDRHRGDAAGRGPHGARAGAPRADRAAGRHPPGARRHPGAGDAAPDRRDRRGRRRPRAGSRPHGPRTEGLGRVRRRR